MLIVAFFVFFSGIIVAFFGSYHLISVFIGTEFMMLGVIYLCGLLVPFKPLVLFLIMCLGVCEASVCLALLVMVVRSGGNDLVSSLSLY